MCTIRAANDLDSKRLPTETASELEALLPAILVRTFNGK